MDLGTRMVLCACAGAALILLYRIQQALRRIATWLESIATARLREEERDAYRRARP